MTNTSEPSRVTAGDTVTWQKTLSDYPASDGWVLSYRLVNAAGHIDITASASGSDHLISVDSSTWAAGVYAWQGYVTKAGKRTTIGRGQITIEANFASAAALDGRSVARQILDNLMDAYKTASAQKAFVQEYEIVGRRMKFNAKTDWIAEINFWTAEVAREENAARRAAGKGLGTRIYERF